jgi:hypothetical protein
VRRRRMVFWCEIGNISPSFVIKLVIIEFFSMLIWFEILRVVLILMLTHQWTRPQQRNGGI